MNPVNGSNAKPHMPWTTVDECNFINSLRHRPSPLDPPISDLAAQEIALERYLVTAQMRSRWDGLDKPQIILHAKKKLATVRKMIAKYEAREVIG